MGRPRASWGGRCSGTNRRWSRPQWRALRAVFAEAGDAWVTSHIYRKTVATLMDDGGLTACRAADQLGHAKVSITQDNYFGRRVTRTGADDLLAIFGASDSGANPGDSPGTDHDTDKVSGA